MPLFLFHLVWPNFSWTDGKKFTCFINAVDTVEINTRVLYYDWQMHQQRPGFHARNRGKISAGGICHSGDSSVLMWPDLLQSTVSTDFGNSSGKLFDLYVQWFSRLVFGEKHEKTQISHTECEIDTVHKVQGKSIMQIHKLMKLRCKWMWIYLFDWRIGWGVLQPFLSLKI